MEKEESASDGTLPKEGPPRPKWWSSFAEASGVRNDAKLLCWSTLYISWRAAQLDFHAIVKIAVLPPWSCIHVAFVLADETVCLIITEKPER